MSELVRKVVLDTLKPPHAHVDSLIAFEAITAAQARKRPHKDVATIWELLAHIVYWQEIMLTRIGGGTPKNVAATAAEGWPKMPPVKDQAKAWVELVARYAIGRDMLLKAAHEKDLEKPMSPSTKRTYLEQLIDAGQHVSYHIGQVVIVRRMLGLWPPPSGGATW